MSHGSPFGYEDISLRSVDRGRTVNWGRDRAYTKVVLLVTEPHVPQSFTSAFTSSLKNLTMISGINGF